MPTGNAKTKPRPAAGRPNPEPRATRLRFSPGRLVVVLDDAREVSLPLKWYPTLHRARPAAQPGTRKARLLAPQHPSCIANRGRTGPD